MRVTQDPGEETRAGQPAGTAVPGESLRVNGAYEVPDRIRAARRARRRARFRQAVGSRRRTAAPWLETLGRAWMGIALLALVGGVVWVETSLSRPAAGPATPEVEPTATPLIVLAPEASPEPLLGPEVGHSTLEANGLIMGCTYPPRLDDLRTRLGADLVGECVDDPIVDAAGATLQRTTRGDLLLRADDRASFTNGEHTWIVGPDGLVRRKTEERFAWEPDAEAGPRPAGSTHVLPPTRPGAVLPAKRIVSYYGNPLAAGMGVLGEMPPEQLFPRLKTQAEAYRAADRTREVVPALELVAVVAQAQPGLDGLYRLRMESELIERVAAWAEERGYLLILDVQIGRGKVDEEVRWLLPYLQRPNVHLALDPEFAMPAGRVPGERIGTMDAAEINGALQTLAELVDEHGLPPKLLVVHRFTEDMVTNHQKIAMDPRVQVVMVMDGFGSPGIKTRQYAGLIADQRVQYTGFKLFYRHDTPLMTPPQVLELEPAPDLIIYQ
jgi:hypothetical protein